MKLNELLEINASTETSVRDLIEVNDIPNPISLPMFSKTAIDIFFDKEQINTQTNDCYFLTINHSKETISFDKKSISFDQFRANGFTDLINQF
ncbi:TPA: hypothetical protein N2299_001830 [Enterobacter hormaechei]|uniref:hypothetical protein n=1 Tax=Enterobacter cloacae complex TaxID=354276 RepID=UPI0005EF0EDC|nr:MULTISPECIES: hypothetical protein [Enterobacter cloacae complex]CAE6319877.1 hypothetical protein AI2716V1_0385 [Enterobacter cloacae]HED3541873.1 hypothetical protein [Enterobacter hormaechei subsp. hormaechei]ELD3451354.1 hypothetical protein [Enterobacter hormaechei]KJO78497.1 hypothetical protein SR98_14000 [Enterobacter hormaechei subsp. xiangfangensis]KJP33670.1 hypothetical protein SR78_10095 [Enterobacter hormaechei subsp. xiangfangensis]